MALHRWERFLRVSFTMFLIFENIFDHIFGINTIDFIQKASSNVQFRGPLNIETLFFNDLNEFEVFKPIVSSASIKKKSLRLDG